MIINFLFHELAIRIVAALARTGIFQIGIQHLAMPPSIHHSRYAAVQAHMKSLREGAGFTQAELADVLGVNQSYVSKVERGERYVDILLYLDWCRGCQVGPKKAVAALEQAGA